MTPNLHTLFLLCFLLGSCENKQVTSSKQRLESVANITLPATFNVLRDEFQNMGQDYAVLYDLTFDRSSMRDLSESIKNSRFYHPNGSLKMYSDSIMNRKPNDFSLWFPVPKGYEFNGKDGDVLYSIKVDMTKGSLNYLEYVL